MRIKTFEDRFLYVPNRREGTCDFNGVFQPTEEVEELIQKEGLEFIRNKILSIVESRKEMYGDASSEFYGMYPQQRFYDLQNRIMFEVRALILPEDNIVTIKKIESIISVKKQSNIHAYNFIKSGLGYQYDCID
ncbi:hypothetical protein [Tenacibaculum agarivorans]|uniref:hypothetical protein n=1 Tax=Tenacibaculum agarivorans TaxID=1908389 RepID=UPI00094B9D99|nr:hypothetical protein [Tenacibaculum agarivorans]